MPPKKYHIVQKDGFFEVWDTDWAEDPSLTKTSVPASASMLRKFDNLQDAQDFIKSLE